MIVSYNLSASHRAYPLFAALAPGGNERNFELPDLPTYANPILESKISFALKCNSFSPTDVK